LLERFEAEHGTLVTLSLFTGPFGLLPGGIYIGIERLLLRSNTAIQGASIWVFLLLASEAMKTYKAHPYFSLGDVKIPTWTTPLVIILFVSFLVPHTSLIGHLCGAVIGYLWGLNYIRFLVPPERILRFVEGKLNLLGRLPHYVSIDQKTYGRYGVLPTTTTPPHAAPALSGPDGGVPLSYIGSSQRLGT
ncbi:rhomboid protein-like protein, partial [Cryomyces antarcticus]